jgi:hypothetical protein
LNPSIPYLHVSVLTTAKYCVILYNETLFSDTSVVYSIHQPNECHSIPHSIKYHLSSLKIDGSTLQGCSFFFKENYVSGSDNNATYLGIST